MAAPRLATSRIVPLGRAGFSARFGTPDLTGALCGYTRPDDTEIVLTLLCHARPLRGIELGTARGT
jgi:hypothetical protein